MVNYDNVSRLSELMANGDTDSSLTLTTGEIRAFLVISLEDRCNDFLLEIHPTRSYPQPNFKEAEALRMAAKAMDSKWGINQSDVPDGNDVQA